MEGGWWRVGGKVEESWWRVGGRLVEGLVEGSPAANSCPDLTFDFCEVKQL